jgi:hypothetical protein
VIRRPAVYIGLVVFLISVCACQALLMVQERGDWPTSWPKELEPYRQAARTESGLGQVAYQLFVSDRREFEHLWPTVLKVREPNGSLRLRSGDVPCVRILAPAPPSEGRFRGKTAHIGPPWPDSARNPDGSLPELLSWSFEKETWIPASVDGSTVLSHRAVIGIELIVDGMVIDLNRIRLPADTRIIDDRDIDDQVSASRRSARRTSTRPATVPTSHPARFFSPEEVLQEMEKTEAAMGRFDAQTDLTVRTWSGNGAVPRPKPVAHFFYEWAVSGNRFRVVRPMGDRESGYWSEEVTFDGAVYSTFDRRSGAATHGARPQWLSTHLVEPRQLAYWTIDGRSRIQDLREFARAGGLHVANVQLGYQPTVCLDTPRNETGHRGYRMWLDPSHAFLPVKIEEYLGDRLVCRTADIYHKDLGHGVWFPMGGKFQQIDDSGPGTPAHIRALVFFDVLPGSVRIPE